MTNYSWLVTNMTHTTDNGVVYNVQYQVKAELNGQYAVIHKVARLSGGDPSDPNFIPYADLTQADVVGWLQADGNQAACEAELTRMLTNETSTASSDGLPWREPQP